MHKSLTAVDKLSRRHLPLAKYCRFVGSEFTRSQFWTQWCQLLDFLLRGRHKLSSDRTVCVCVNSISNWVQDSFAVYIVTHNHPLCKYAAQLSADGVSNVLWNVREVNTVLFFVWQK